MPIDEPDRATACPIVMTLQLDAAATARFQRQRDALFPAALNRVPAHLTLFHALPGSELTAIIAAAADVASRTPPFPVAVTGVVGLGRGIAYELRSAVLDRLRAELAARYAPCSPVRTGKSSVPTSQSRTR